MEFLVSLAFSLGTIVFCYPMLSFRNVHLVFSSPRVNA